MVYELRVCTDRSGFGCNVLPYSLYSVKSYGNDLATACYTLCCKLRGFFTFK